MSQGGDRSGGWGASVSMKGIDWLQGRKYCLQRRYVMVCEKAWGGYLIFLSYHDSSSQSRPTAAGELQGLIPSTRLETATSVGPTELLPINQQKREITIQ